MCWLKGMAGTGKTAILQTLCEMLARENLLAGSFFYAHGVSARNTTASFSATIARQLLVSNPHLERSILLAGPLNFEKNFEEQFGALVFKPITKSLTSMSTAIVLVVDGLDECEDEEAVRLISHLFRLVQECQSSSIKIRILCASRPEPHLQRAFDRGSPLIISLQSFDTRADVELFYQVNFSEVLERRSHKLAHVPRPWPSASDIQSLATRTGSLFIHAVTVIKFVDQNYKNPASRLRQVLDDGEELSGANTLNSLYRMILSTHPDYSTLRDAIGVIITLEQQSLQHVDAILKWKPDSAANALTGVHSVILVPHDLKKMSRYSTNHSQIS